MVRVNVRRDCGVLSPCTGLKRHLAVFKLADWCNFVNIDADYMLCFLKYLYG